MINGLFGVRFLFSGTKMERCSIDDYSSILQRPQCHIEFCSFKKVLFSYVLDLVGNSRSLFETSNK